MQNHVPNSLASIGTDWISEVLRGQGNQTASVTSVRIEALDAENSTVARLHLSGSIGGSQLPATLFLKFCSSGHSFLGTSELAYYTRDYQGLIDAPIVPCHAAIGRHDLAMVDALGAGYALLLADLTASHTDNKLIKPTARHAKRLGRALGQLHAHRWGANADPEGPHDLDADLDRCLAHISRGLSPVLNVLGETINADERDRLHRVFIEDVERLRARARTGAGLTLVHADPNPTNVLTPRAPDRHDAPDGKPALFLIDRQPFDWSLRLWLGASDLVLASVPYWSIEARRAHERSLLDGYHTALVEGGVSDYSWDALLDDWHACLCHAALVAIEWGTDTTTLKTMRWLWEAQIRRALAALKDWGHGEPLLETR